MRSQTSLVSELKQEILGYLERERARAATSTMASERGSVVQHESAARTHQINTIMVVVSGIFRHTENSLDQDNEAQEDRQEGSQKEGTKS